MEGEEEGGVEVEEVGVGEEEAAESTRTTLNNIHDQRTLKKVNFVPNR